MIKSIFSRTLSTDRQKCNLAGTPFTQPSISFGDMPTGQHDVDSQLENDPSFPQLEECDINTYNMALVRTLTRAILSIDFDDFEEKITLKDFFNLYVELFDNFFEEFAEEETIYMRCLSEEYGNDLVSMNVYSEGGWWEPQYFNF